MLNAITNQHMSMYETLKQDISQATNIRRLVSFVMEKGVALILDDLLAAAKRVVPIRILTSTYMGVTEPSALYMLRRSLGNKIDVMRDLVNKGVNVDAANNHAIIGA